MPSIVGWFRPAGGIRSISGGSFFESTLNDPPSSDFPTAGSRAINFPSAVKWKIMPPCGIGRSMPPATPFWLIHSPMIVGSFFGASFGPGAATSRDNPSNSDVFMAGSDRRLVLLGAFEGHDDRGSAGGRLELRRPRARAAAPAVKTQGQRVAVEFVDAEDGRLLLVRGRYEVDFGRVLLRVRFVRPGLRLPATALHDCQHAVGREGNSDAPRGNRQVHPAGHSLFTDPLADDGGLFFRRILGARGRDQQGHSRQYRRVHESLR